MNTLFIELAFDAVGRFSDLCKPKCVSLELRAVSDRHDIAMMKCWLGWISKKINVSAYRFVARIFARLNQNPLTNPKILSGAFLGKLDDAGDCDLIHLCFFGAFISLEEEQKIIHQPVKAFILQQEAKNFVLRVRHYKVMLDLIKNTLDLSLSLQPGLVYAVNPETGQVTECIRIDTI